MGKTFEALEKYKKEKDRDSSDLGQYKRSRNRLKEDESERLVTQTKEKNLNIENNLSGGFTKLEKVISNSQKHQETIKIGKYKQSITTDGQDLILSECEKSDPPINNSYKEQHAPAGPTATQYDSNNFDKKLISIIKPNSFEAEQFKILRTNVLFPNSANPPRSILVSSTAPGDGKTFVAANLAINVSLTINRHVLLIDCDLRRPTVHSCFGFGQVSGLSDYLNKKKDIADLLLRTNLERLVILPAGQTPPNPSELLSSKRMSYLLKEVVDRYNDRLIILDSPPPLLISEATVLARHVDGIILVVNYGKTRRTDLKNLVSKLGSKKILGTVMNNVNLRTLNCFVSKKYCKYGSYYSKSENCI